METALTGIGIKPRHVCLPTDVGKYDINIKDLPEMDWPSMLVIFGCCSLVLLKNHTNEASYKACMSNCIRELQKRTGFDPARANVINPFDFQGAKAIRAMLGVASDLRKCTMQYIMSLGNGKYYSSGGIGAVCQYLYNVLAWSGMEEFTAMNDMLVKLKSPVLHDPRVSSEMKKLAEACEAVRSHRHPQFFAHLASDAKQLKVTDSSRFPTLIAVAQELERGGDGSTVVVAGTSVAAGVNLATVQELVGLHRRVFVLRPKVEVEQPKSGLKRPKRETTTHAKFELKRPKYETTI